MNPTYNSDEYRRGDPRAKTILKLDTEMVDALFNCRSPNARQSITLMQLGINTRRSGWIDKLIGTQISAALYEELISCKGRKPKGLPKKEWAKPCEPCQE